MGKFISCVMNHHNISHETSMMEQNDDMMMMQMTFYFSSRAVILFKEWNITTWKGMLGSCITIFIMAALYEGLKVFRAHLLQKSLSSYNSSQQVSSSSANDDPLIQTPVDSIRFRHNMVTCGHIQQSLLHILQVVMSYFLMLIFMTFNGWLCISVALGAGVGYFLFSWNRSVIIDINEHCH